MRTMVKLVLASVLLTGFAVVVNGPTEAAVTAKRAPFSQTALMSRFVRENFAGEAIELAKLEAAAAKVASPDAGLAPGQANADYNRRPQNETSIAVKPGTGGATWVMGANDYGIGVPIGGGVYNSAGVTYFPPFPLLVGKGGSGSSLLVEPPTVTGDPAVAYGRTRAAAGQPAGRSVVYYSSLAASANFCENGIIVMRSFDDGATWNRATVPMFAPPRGIGFVTYYDSAQNCAVFNDKEYIAVDTTGGPHDGRVYVTWTQFLSTPPLQAPILMAWSDDNGLTFSDPVAVHGASAQLCGTRIDGAPNPGAQCNSGQGSIPMVLPDGKVAVSFTSFQGAGVQQGRDQLLLTVFDPDTGRITGPHHVANLVNGFNDYPVQNGAESRQTLCNANFRATSFFAGAAADRAGTLYVTYHDHAKRAGTFPFPTVVGSRADGYPCPDGKSSDTDVTILRSSDSGQTWADVTPPAGKDVHDQWFPWVAAGASGEVSVVFYDRSGDPGNKLTHTRLVRSADGGDTWSSTVVSDFASNFDDSFFGDGGFIGDYLGNAIDDTGASHPAWTAVVPGKQDSDVFTATVGP